MALLLAISAAPPGEHMQLEGARESTGEVVDPSIVGTCCRGSFLAAGSQDPVATRLLT